MNVPSARGPAAARGRGRPRLAVALLVAALAAGVAGCGSSASGKTPAAASSSTDREAQLVRYAQCMRQHGVPDFPDPVDGRLQLQARKGTDLDPQSAQFTAAQQACRSVEPPGLQNPGSDPRQMDAMRKYAECMRADGVPNFPDPQPDGRFVFNGGQGVDPDSATFKAAQAKCEPMMAPGTSTP